tara:strand:+ start:2085 stop:2288 length:204 start_codon:yes stop_codon:yes gene_type:complete
MTLEQDFLDGLKAIIDMRGEKNAPLSKRSGMGDTVIRDLFRNGSMPNVAGRKVCQNGTKGLSLRNYL